MNAQRTLRRPISCAGIGLHSGHKVTLSLKPAQADSGIRFRRSDLGGLEVPARVDHVCGINYATGLSRDTVKVDTVEHLLAALVSLGIDNVIVESRAVGATPGSIHGTSQVWVKQKSSSSTSVGVSAIGSISLPLSSTQDSMVKVGSDMVVAVWESSRGNKLQDLL